MAWEQTESLARRKAGGGPDWKVAKMEWIGDSMLIEGGDARPIKSGPNKGRPTWRECKVFDKIILTQAEIEAEEAAYETTTGNCHQCNGTGKRLVRSSVLSGKEYGPCRRCGGTGVRP